MARRKKSSDDLYSNTELPMTPMIDIIFQLLIFFMCSMHFKQLEGKLNSWLPKDKGLNPVSVPKPELQEIRIVMDWDGDDKQGRTRVSIERRPVGDVAYDRVNAHEPPEGRSIWQSLAAQVGGQFQAAKSKFGRDIPVIIDARSKVPWAHVIQALDACKQHNIEKVEFAGSPEHEPGLKNK